MMTRIDNKKFQVWGYPEKKDPLWNQKGQYIGSTDEEEEARRLKESAVFSGWKTVVILEKGLIVE